MKHKWHKEIKAWADGAEIECKYMRIDNKWSEWIVTKKPVWDSYDQVEYRIKLQPKEPKYLYVYFNERTEKIDFDVIACDLGYLQYIGKIKLENDDAV
jgi:hypothetical protein